MQIKKEEFLNRYQEVCRWENRAMAALAVLAVVAYFGIPHGLKAVGSSLWVCSL